MNVGTITKKTRKRVLNFKIIQIAWIFFLNFYSVKRKIKM